MSTATDIAENKTVFGAILRGEIPCTKVYEDENILAFNDIEPKADVHVVVIPKRTIVKIADVNNSNVDIVTPLLVKIPEVAKIAGCDKFDGFRLITNSGAGAGQTVDHLHFHILAGNGELNL